MCIRDSSGTLWAQNFCLKLLNSKWWEFQVSTRYNKKVIESGNEHETRATAAIFLKIHKEFNILVMNFVSF